MSYLVQSRMVADESIRNRVAACAAMQQIPEPATWAWDRRWELSAQPDWATRYEAALNAGSEDPGADETAITDAMILTAVQLLTEEAT